MNDVKNEINRCVLCYNAPCKKMYGDINPERVVRALKFDNEKGASSLLYGKKIEKTCDNNCPLDVDIDKILNSITGENYDIDNVDITTNICGIKLENPFLLSSSTVSSTYDMCKRALESGFAGIVFKTICPFDIHECSPRFSALKNHDNSFIGFKNIEQLSKHTLEEDCTILTRLKKEFPNKVIIASIMGRDEKEWEYVSKKVEETGCDAIELNFSCPNMELGGTGVDIGQDPEAVKKYTRAAKRGTTLPLIAKLTPNITNIIVPARAAKEAGASGLSAINTIKSITGVDINTHVPEPDVNGYSSIGGYSGRAIKPIALRYVAELTGETDTEVSAIGGIYTYKDAIEFLLLGANNVQLTTSIMEYGYRVIDDLILGLKIFMCENGFKKTSDFIGLSKKCMVPLDNLERDTILFPKFDYDRCIKCGRCYISCRDGGHQAIIFDTTDRKPILQPSKCVGCHLCKLVCPNKAIEIAKKRILK